MIPISDTAITIFIFASCTFALIQVRSLIAEAFQVQKQLDKKLANENEKKATLLEDATVTWSRKKQFVESKIISEQLHSIGIISDDQIAQPGSSGNWTSRDLDSKPVLYGGPVLQASGSCHLNIVIPYLTSAEQTREFIFQWAEKILVTIARSKTDVRQYSITFWRRDGNKADTDFGMMKASRDDVMNAVSKNLHCKDFIKSLPGRYLSAAVAEF